MGASERGGACCAGVCSAAFVALAMAACRSPAKAEELIVMMSEERTKVLKVLGVLRVFKVLMALTT
jgi:hypothetical protein